MLDNLALRQQLAALAHGGRRPRLVTVDRLFWVALREVWADWSTALAIARPATVVAWHRRAYRAYWQRISRRSGRPRIDGQLRELIARMVRENRWGAPRIHGELVKLGFRVSERTVSRYVRLARPRRPSGTSWKTFLANHREVLIAMDFFTVPTLTFRLLYVLFIINRHLPAGTARSHDRAERGAPVAAAARLRRVLPRGPHTPFARQGPARATPGVSSAIADRQGHCTASHRRPAPPLRVDRGGVTGVDRILARHSRPRAPSTADTNKRALTAGPTSDTVRVCPTGSLG